MRIARKLLAAAFLAGSAHTAQTMAGTITVYSALESDEISTYLAAARQAMPDLQVKVLRLSTGDLAARLLAESASPRNDVIWGEALTDMLDPRIGALLAPAGTASSARLAPRYRAADGSWFAATGYVAALCVNEEALKAQHLPMPTSWADLAKPVYKGQVVMPDPESSGTGYMMIATLLQAMGPEKGWPMLGALAGNMAQFTKSGSGPCKLARTGEYPIGVSFAYVAQQAIAQGFPVKMVIPSDYEGYELEASALMRNARNPADARRFLDWTLSPQAVALYRRYKSIVSVPGSAPTPEQVAAGLPADIEHRLYPLDFQASSRDRAAITAKWKRDIAH
jgi:iron(III) transport system substrate-binding protein